LHRILGVVLLARETACQCQERGQLPFDPLLQATVSPNAIGIGCPVSRSHHDLVAGELDHLDPRSRAAISISYVVERAERRFAGSASPEVEKSAREHLSVRELNEVDAIVRAMALANLSLNTLSALKLPSGTGAGQHPVFARVWSHMSGRVGSDGQRSELLAGLRGRVLEVGAGDGRCKASVNPFKLSSEDFIPQVKEIIAVGEFYALAGGGQIVFT
jgi:hypothetical protein